MALYKKHRGEWEKSQRPIIRKESKSKSKSKSKAGTEPVPKDEEEEGLEIKPKSKIRSKKRKIEELEEHPGAGVKGYSSGLTTVIKRRNETQTTTKAAWWSTIEPNSNSVTGSGSKGSLKLRLNR
jgi:RNA exonuclease 4